MKNVRVALNNKNSYLFDTSKLLVVRFVLIRAAVRTKNCHILLLFFNQRVDAFAFPS